VVAAPSEKAANQNVMLVLENEYACNTATGREAAATLSGVPSKNLALNWDPGNAVMRGELDTPPEWLECAPQGSLSPLPRQKRGQGRLGQDRLVARRYRPHPLDRAVLCSREDWLLGLGQPGEALEGRQFVGIFFPAPAGPS
jgi:hypothetical protein